MKALVAATLVVGAGIGTGLGLAAPATAGENEFLHPLADRLTYLTADQLLTEGYKVCRYVNAGHATPGAIPFVSKDLNISVSAATEIVTAGATRLDC